MTWRSSRSESKMLGIAVDSLLNVYSLMVILRIVLSFTGGVHHPHWSVRVIRRVTDPVFEIARKAVPPIGGTLDVSGFIVLVVLYVLRMLIRA
jgi:uncharacterized protein YggT (Ycf19 family)